jgi:hypothetical protein
MGRIQIPCFDADYSPAEDSHPPAILLDYVYGVAAYERWKFPAIQPIVEAYFHEHYESIPLLPRPESFDSETGVDETDGSPSTDYVPSTPRYGRSFRGGLAKAMDEMNFFMMSLWGITPQALSEKRQKEEEERQLKAQEESQAKVSEWLQIHPL